MLSSSFMPKELLYTWCEWRSKINLFFVYTEKCMEPFKPLVHQESGFFFKVFRYMSKLEMLVV